MHTGPARSASVPYEIGVFFYPLEEADPVALNEYVDQVISQQGGLF